MKQNRMIHALLAAAVAAGLVLPASAAGTSSFSDVKDPATSVNADILRLMGVADGTGDNRFTPSQKLTRAQFCTMVVNFMGMGDDVVLHSTRTIFTDVPSSHWARGYVNLAASTMLEDGGSSSGTGSDSDPKPAGTPLISGIGDGRFLPDSQLTYAQAVTILIRVLGYSSNKVGAVWPDGYLNLAQSIGLTEGISAGPNAPIDRAQAAQLFVNALSCETGDGKEYYTTLGSAKEDTILLAVNTETDDGSALGAVRTSNGTYLPDAEDVAPTALVGTMLSIKPVLHVDDEGRLSSVSKARGRKAALMALVDRMEATALDAANGTVFISHGDCEGDALLEADEITRRFGYRDIHLNYVGPVIGNHSGPGTVALFFVGSKRWKGDSKWIGCGCILTPDTPDWSRWRPCSPPWASTAW